MKRLVFAVTASLIAAAALAQGTAPAAAPVTANMRLGVINVERLVQESALGKEAFGRVKKLNDLKKDEADKLSKELRDMEQKLADQGSALADDKREQLQKSYQEKAIAFKRFQDDANRDLETAQKKELGELEKRVFPIINQVGKERGYTLIFNKFQSGLVFADDSVDITDEVLKVFNTTVAVPSAKPAEGSAAKSAAPAAKSAAPAPAAKSAPPAPAPTKKP
ncbi:MAG TPA: OmpH family outer membrane protein [Thermoanaerobaculia bacterium]|jgi:outer membrane protein